MKNKIAELLKLTDDGQIVAKLQEINELFLRQYLLNVDGIIAQPLQVEAYYNNPGVFEDMNSHCNFNQKNRFGRLYFHGYPARPVRVGDKTCYGVDIVLSDSDDYYLSLLLKRSCIGNDVLTQTKVDAALRGHGDLNAVVLTPRQDKKSGPVFHIKRIGLNNPNKQYRDAALGAIIDLDKYPTNAFAYPRGGRHQLINNKE
ncbi:MAG: hypothetical protein LBJ73_02090 [Rickettsiales bacterium]|jgi:hypothetical protein|nr:hypothetical protein [Rickettsiales bacterium]